jgi:hypothetical protein
MSALSFNGYRDNVKNAALIGAKVQASMDGFVWFSGVLIEIEPVFVPYKILINGGYRNFEMVRTPE